MQTNFTTEQLADPDIQVADKILRSCVHCGFCTATCPTFVTVGDEDDSPRGRIYLIKDMLENNGGVATAPVAYHLDRCLSCLACMTTCPSGVDYMHLIDQSRTRIEETYDRPWHDRAVRTVLALVLPYPKRMRWALRAAAAGKPAKGLIPESGLLGKRLRAMLELAPKSLPRRSRVERGGVFPAVGKRRGRVSILSGCAQQVLDPAINEATIRLLNRQGVEVVIPPSAGCCGALTHHLGKHESAMAMARNNIAAWMREVDGAGLDAIIVNTSGCGTVLKDYGFLFHDQPEAAAAAKIAALTMDISEYLLKSGYQPKRQPTGMRITYHSACSLQHGQRVTEGPKILLQQAGFTVVEPRDPHLCCGSAGTYNILQPEMAAALRERKIETLRATRPSAIAAGNVGCLNQLGGLGIPTVHTVQLLDWMAGGPAPAFVGGTG
jgi:glycolate oxidase iron-sulfur subunit